MGRDRAGVWSRAREGRRVHAHGVPVYYIVSSSHPFSVRQVHTVWRRPDLGSGGDDEFSRLVGGLSCGSLGRRSQALAYNGFGAYGFSLCGTLCSASS